MARYESIRLILGLTAHYDLELHNMDVDVAFLNGELEEKIYCEDPGGLGCPSGHILRVHKALYGLKQSPRVFNKDFHKTLVNLGLKQSKADPCIYHLITKRRFIVVGIFVDDVLIATRGNKDMQIIKRCLTRKYSMSDKKEVDYFLGMEIERDRKQKTLKIHQTRYVTDVLKKFNMMSANPVRSPMNSGTKLSKQHSPTSPQDVEFMKDKPYRQLIGSLLYAAISTRPDISYSVSFLSRFLSCPGPAHWKAAKRILRYLRGTISKGIVYSGPKYSYYSDNRLELIGYVDAAYGDDEDTRRSTSGFVFMLANGAITWQSKRQPTVAGSTAEAEYYGAYYACQEACWLLKFVKEFKLPIQLPLILKEDNQACIRISENPTAHKRSKHIDIKYHFLREKVLEGTIALHYINTLEQLADVFTKALDVGKFEEACRLLRLK